jgi:acyl-CoA synthetase (AMP-forming)/AMP-acid ligase II
MPQETARVLDEAGWYRTGDAGRLDEDGYLFIQDRVKDMIVSGAENVYPAEVENAIAGHPDVAEVAVIGVPDAHWGEAVKAIVVPRPGREVDVESVIAWSRQRIAAFKAPKTVDIVAELPHSASGKIQKNELRKRYWGDAERQVN